MLKVSPANFIVVWDKVVSTFASDAQVDVSNLRVVMYKQDILIEQESVNEDD